MGVPARGGGEYWGLPLSEDDVRGELDFSRPLGFFRTVGECHLCPFVPSGLIGRLRARLGAWTLSLPERLAVGAAGCAWEGSCELFLPAGLAGPLPFACVASPLFARDASFHSLSSSLLEARPVFDLVTIPFGLTFGALPPAPLAREIRAPRRGAALALPLALLASSGAFGGSIALAVVPYLYLSLPGSRGPRELSAGCLLPLCV